MAIAKQEAEMVLSLIQYFNPFWLIIDVGSNKGEWFDTFIDYRDCSTEARKYTIYSIEPNDKLRDYQQVKYDYNDRILYVNYVIANKPTQIVDFYYWQDKHSGLSSMFDNPRWRNELGESRYKKSMMSTDLDSIYFGFMGIEEIDIVKIDVEGAERLVIDGAMELLKNKQIKFIQIEYSEHYQVGGFTFKSIIELVNSLGYKVWSWDGKYFNEVKLQEFVEDYRAENFIISHLEIGRFEYTQLWNSEFIKNTEFLKDKGEVHTALEIGCFEGLTSNYICDHLLAKDGRLICIDPLTDIYLPDHKDNEMFKGQYERFIKNTKGQPIELIRKSSKNAFEQDLKPYAFDLIYIDGDHTYEAVLSDGTNAYWQCKIGGYILFDDYGQSEETKRGVDEFIEEFSKWERIKVISIGYQVLVKKTA